jgi:hypothetical protein
MLSGASRVPAPRRPSGGSALLAARSRAVVIRGEVLVGLREQDTRGCVELPSQFAAPLSDVGRG